MSARTVRLIHSTEHMAFAATPAVLPVLIEEHAARVHELCVLFIRDRIDSELSHALGFFFEQIDEKFLTGFRELHARVRLTLYDGFADGHPAANERTNGAVERALFLDERGIMHDASRDFHRIDDFRDHCGFEFDAQLVTSFGNGLFGLLSPKDPFLDRLIELDELRVHLLLERSSLGNSV